LSDDLQSPVCGGYSHGPDYVWGEMQRRSFQMGTFRDDEKSRRSAQSVRGFTRDPQALREIGRRSRHAT